MKKRFASILLSLAMVISCLFMFSACGDKKDKEPEGQTPAAPTVESLLVEAVTTGITITDNTITYAYGVKVELDADDFKITANYSDETTKEIELKSDENEDGYTFASTVPTGDPTAAGEYKLTFTYSEKNAEVKIKVNKGTVDMTGVEWDYDAAFTYDKTEKIVEIDESTLPEGVSVVSYEGNTATDADTYRATVNFAYADASNYEAIAPMTLDWTINKADIDVSGVSLTTGGYYYNGESVTPGVLNLPENVTAAPVVAGSNTKTNAGRHEVEYAFTYTGEDAANYNAIPNRTLWFEIYKGTLVATAKRTLSYNGAEQTFPISEIKVPVGVEITGITNNTGIEIATYTATITVSYAPELLANYEEVTTLQVSWKIVKANYDMSGVSWDYDSATPFVYNGQTQTVEITGTLPTGVTVKTYTGNSAKDVNADGFVASVTFNYDSVHYNAPSFASLEWRIEPATLVVKAKDASVSYGTLAENTGVDYSGFVGTEDENVLDGTLLYQYSGYNKNSRVGTYIITPYGLTSTNYTIDYQSGTLTVTKLTIDLSTATWNYPSPVDYDGQVHKPTINGVPADVNVTYTYKKAGEGTPIENPKNAGSYVAEAVFGAANENYEVINTGSLQNHPFTINKLALTVTIDNKEIFYQEAAPAFTAKYTGFATGENESVLSGDLIVLCSYQVGDPVGNYDIVNNGSTLTSENYVISVVAGTLEVKKANVNVSTAVWGTLEFTYTGAAHKPTIASGLPAWVTSISYSYLQGSGMTAAPVENPINAGEYTAVATVSDTDNYTVEGEVAPATFTILKATLTLSVDDAEIEYYDAYNPTVSYSGFVGTDTYSTVDFEGDYNFSHDYLEGSNVGNYTISVSGDLSSTNYEIEYASGTLEVTMKVHSVEEFSWTKEARYVYGTRPMNLPYLSVPTYIDSALSYVYNNGTNDVDLPENAGVYTVTAVFGDGEGNWRVDGEASTTFEIEKAVIEADSIYWSEDLDLEEKYEIYFDGHSHGLYIINSTEAELMYEAINEYNFPGDNINHFGATFSTAGEYEYGVLVSLTPAAEENYVFAATEYYATLVIKDYIESYTFSVVDAESTEVESDVVTEFNHDSSTTGYDAYETIVTGFELNMVEAYQSVYTYEIYTDYEFTNVVDFTKIEDLENELYVVIYNQGEKFDLRRIKINLNYSISTSDSSNVQISVSKEAVSFMTEAASYSLTPALAPANDETSVLEYAHSKIALWNASLETPAYDEYADSVSISDGVNRAKLQFAYIINGTSYSYTKEITIVKTAPSSTYCDVSGNEMYVDDIDLTNGLDASNIQVAANDGYTISNKEVFVDETGAAFLVVTFEADSNFSFSPYSVMLYDDPIGDIAETVTCYIRLKGLGIIDKDVRAIISVWGDDYVDHQEKVIHVTEGNEILVDCLNENAAIYYKIDNQSSNYTGREKGSAYIVVNNLDASENGVFYIRIVSTYNLAKGLGNSPEYSDTWVEYKIVVEERKVPGGGDIPEQPGYTPFPEGVDVTITLDENIDVSTENGDIYYDNSLGGFVGYIDADWEDFQEVGDDGTYITFSNVLVNITNPESYDSYIIRDFANYTEVTSPFRFKLIDRYYINVVCISISLLLEDQTVMIVDICVMFNDSTVPGGPGGPGGAGDSNTSYTVRAEDVFGNTLNANGENLGTSIIDVIIFVTQGEEYDTLTLLDWNETKYINITAESSSALVTLSIVNDNNGDGYENAAPNEVEIIAGPVNNLQYNFREEGIYYVTVVAGDQYTTRTLVITVEGDFAPFVEISANDKTLTQNINERKDLYGEKSELVWFENKMLDNDIENLEAYVGEAVNLEVGATYEISVSTALYDFIYAVDVEGAIDANNKLALENGKLTLEVRQDDDGFKYVVFAIAEVDEIVGTLSVVSKDYCVYVFFCNRADRLSYHTLSVGDSSFEISANVLRYGDFGDVTVDYETGTGYVIVKENDFNAVGTTYVVFDAYEGYSIPEDTLDYLILTEDGFDALASAFNPEGSYSDLLTLVKALIDEGMAFHGTSLEIPVSFGRKGIASFYIVAEGVNAYTYAYLEDFVVPFEIRAEEVPEYTYDDEMIDGLTIDLVVNGVTYSTTTGDFYFEDDIPEYYVRLDNTAAELISQDTGKVVISSFTAEGFNFKLYDLDGNELPEESFALTPVRHPQFGDGIMLEARLVGTEMSATFVFVFNDSVPRFTQMRYPDALPEDISIDFSFMINETEYAYSSSEDKFYANLAAGEYGYYYVYTRVDFERADVEELFYDEMYDYDYYGTWLDFESFNITLSGALEGATFSHFVNGWRYENEDGHTFTTPARAGFIHSNDLGNVLTVEAVYLLDEEEITIYFEIVLADSVPMPYEQDELEDMPDGGEIISVSYGSTTLVSIIDMENYAYTGDFQVVTQSESSGSFVAYAGNILEEDETQFTLDEIVVYDLMFYTEENAYIVITNAAGDVIPHANMIASNVTLDIDTQSNSISFTVTQYYNGNVEMAITYVIYFTEAPTEAE